MSYDSAIMPLALWSSERRKRRCTCGEAVRLPDERREELCEAKSQEAARRASAVACGLEQSAVAHELGKVCVYDAVALLDGIVAREYVLGIVVANAA